MDFADRIKIPSQLNLKYGDYLGEPGLSQEPFKKQKASERFNRRGYPNHCCFTVEGGMWEGMKAALASLRDLSLTTSRN